jgi:hypothetical protein
VPQPGGGASGSPERSAADGEGVSFDMVAIALNVDGVGVDLLGNLISTDKFADT